MNEAFGGVRKTFASGFITATASITAAADSAGTSASLYPIHGNPCVGCIVAGTFTATMAFEGLAADGSTWVSVPAVPVAGGAAVTSITAAGNYLISTHGMYGVRLRCSAFTSNASMTIALQGSIAGAITIGSAASGASANQVQGTAADGAAAAGNPVQVGGVDGSANAQALLVDTSGRLQVVGAAAAGAAAAGNPLLLGFSDGTNAQTWRQAGTALTTGVPAVAAQVYSESTGNFYQAANCVQDATSAIRTQLVNPGTFNETATDRFRGNTVQTAFASAARTSTPTAVNITNYNGRGILLFVDVTAGAVALSLTPSITIRDSIGATAFTAWTAAAPITVTTAARYTYLLYPGSASAGSWTESVQIVMPRQLTINMTHGNANSATYSVTCHTIL